MVIWSCSGGVILQNDEFGIWHQRADLDPLSRK